MVVRALPPAAERSTRRGSLTHIIERCEGTLGWQPPVPKQPKPVDDSQLDFSQCANDDDRDQVRKRAAAMTASMAATSVYRIEVAKLRAAIAKQPNPKLFSAHNLELSLEWCWHKRLRIVSPSVLIYHVEDALKEAAKPEVVIDIMDRRNQAIEYEKHHPDDNSERWLRRLSRAQGAGLIAVVDEWGFARGR